MNFVNDMFSASQLNPAITNWISRVAANGGTTPTKQTIMAANTFYNGLKYYNILPLIKTCSIFAPESLTTALTPLINVNSCAADPWINGGFISSDLSYDGLAGAGITGNGLGKYIDTNFYCQASFSNDDSAGMTCYSKSFLGVGAYGEMGMRSNSGGSEFSAYIAYGEYRSYFDCWDNGGSRAFSDVNYDHMFGYFSFNRDSHTSNNIYHANPSVGHRSIAFQNTPSTNTRPGNSAGESLWMIGMNCTTPLDRYFTNREFSFGAIHLGLNSGQSSILYTLVQNLRVQMGGGYVSL